MRKTVLILLAISSLGVLNAQPASVAAQHQNRAASLLLNQDYEAAIEELEQAAGSYKAAQSWPYYFSCLNQITQAQIELGQLDEAKQSAKKALWQSIETLSRDNDEAAKAAHKLGQVYEAAERYEDAMECHRMAFDIRENLFSRRHPQTAASNIFMAITTRKQGAYTEAAAFLQEAEEILTQYYEAGHPELANVWEERGMLLEKRNEPAQARASYQQAIDILKAFPNQYPEALGRIWCRVARLLPEGQRAQAYQRAYHLFEANERMQNLFAAEAALELAQDALKAGQPALAVQMAKRALSNPNIDLSVAPLLAKAYLLLGQFEPALLHFRDWIGFAPNDLQSEDWANAIEIALLHGQAQTALQWSKVYAERSEGLLARYFVARSYALLDNQTRAQQILQKISRSEEPGSVKALAEEVLGQFDLENGDTESAISHFEAGLAKVSGGSLHKLKLLAVLAQTHTSLALQDRHTVDNINAATGYYGELKMHLTQLQAVPLTPFEAGWMEQHLEGLISSGMQHLYLRQQYARQDFSVEEAYLWFEGAKIALLNFHTQQKQSAPAYWKYRTLRLASQHPYSEEGEKPSSAIAQAWSRARSEQAGQLRYTLSEALSFDAFQGVLSSLDLGCYHYWRSERFLYVLQLHEGSGRLYRTSWRDSTNRTIQDQLLFFPDLQALKEAGTEGVVVFPIHQLSMYPFGQVQLDEGRLAGSFALYRHLCASSFAADRATAAQLPGADAPAYFFTKAGVVPEKETAVALPTSHTAVHGCTTELGNWLKDAQALKTAQQLDGIINARMLLCADANSALALTENQDRTFRTRYLALDGAYTDFFGNSTEGLLNRVWSQQHFTGTFIEQQGLCQTPQAYTAWLDAMASATNLQRQLQLLQNQPGYEVLHSVQAFGAPYDQPEEKPAQIPVFWILGGVFGLILMGLWVRR
ncbi:MAG: tetratricopeptide repeat protein [Phaeodactylibacter sp.]|uniref:tetratricopeptide repeat protein n=1 Tax=Phaeodactylibacter sp. TaxID=1940289 RepID=UPI0032EF30BD